MDKVYLVLWPSFVMAGIADIIFFTVIDPQELYLFGQLVYYSNLETYSIGFFAFWAVCATSSWLTRLLQRSGTDVNRDPSNRVWSRHPRESH